MVTSKTESYKLPPPQILNTILEVKEGGIGELTIEYKLSEVPSTGISGVIVFLRPIVDKTNFPPIALKYPPRGALSTNDSHITFLPPKRGTPAYASVFIPLYTTYQVGIATYRLHEHSSQLIPEGSTFQLDSVGNFQLSDIKTISKTFPAHLELPKGGTVRIEDDPSLDTGPTYLSQASQNAVQKYRLQETFIDSFKTTEFLDLNRSSNIELNESSSGVKIGIKDLTPISDNVQLIDGLKAPDQPTTFILPTPLTTPDVYQFQALTWIGQNVNLYCATGYSIGDVTETENFRLIGVDGNLKAQIKEDSFNLRVDFLTADSYIKNAVLHYTRINPAIIITKVIKTQNNFNQAVVFVDTDGLGNIMVEMSNDGGQTFQEPSGGEGVDIFQFPRPGNHALLKIQVFGDSLIDGYSINTGVFSSAPPDPIDGPSPTKI